MSKNKSHNRIYIQIIRISCITALLLGLIRRIYILAIAWVLFDFPRLYSKGAFMTNILSYKSSSRWWAATSHRIQIIHYDYHVY